MVGRADFDQEEPGREAAPRRAVQAVGLGPAAAVGRAGSEAGQEPVERRDPDSDSDLCQGPDLGPEADFGFDPVSDSDLDCFRR